MAKDSTQPEARSPYYYQPLFRRYGSNNSSAPTLLTIFITASLGIIFAFSTVFLWTFASPFGVRSPQISPFKYSKEDVLARCAALRVAPGPSATFRSRDESDRFEPGTNATLIRNALIFTGKNNGTETFRGDILLDKGIIKGIGKISGRVIDNTPNLTIINVNGAWVTPGLVDLHTYLGVLSVPILSGAVDLNSGKGPILPYLRSIDALNTHDEGYELAMAGGVTSVQVLPGSLNAIGGQAFIVKLRKTKDRSPSSMIVEPPYNLNVPGKATVDYTTTRWRHMKQACGENLRAYGMNRMDTLWALRSAYSEARRIKLSQDEYCQNAESGLWDNLSEPFPDDLRWEMLVDVLRGKIKISSHCYEAVDLDAMVRLSNEFQFPITSFHHASEAWLVPDLLKRMWGGIPSVAIFSTNHRSKREAYRGSEFAGRVLADEGIPVIMKSDHPVLNSRYLMYEAQKAFYYGLPANLALASVTFTPAAAVGLSHRIGILTEGADADVVLWDSHPLQLGATPVKVWVDGILQIPVASKTNETTNIEIGKGKEGEEWRQLPEVPNWDKERKQAIVWDGLPPLEGQTNEKRIKFTNVQEVWRRNNDGEIVQTFSATSRDSEKIQLGTVIVEGGVICEGRCQTGDEESITIDLEGGSISPGMMTYGSPLGLEEIASEQSTGDGRTYDAFRKNVPHIFDDVGAVVRAMDALSFGTRDALMAHRAGVTLATSSLARPIYLAGPDAHVISGLSTSFRTGSLHAMQRGAIVQDITALHIVMGKSYPFGSRNGISVSTQIAGLRRLLYGWVPDDTETGIWFKRAAEGVIPLVIDVDSLDIMANLLILKADVEDKIGSRMKMVFSGAAEAHILAKEISNAGVGVILNPSRPFPMVWDQRRILPGPPLTNDTALVTLLEQGVVVGLGVRTANEAQNTRFDIQWAALEANGRISKGQAYALVSRNLEKLLGIRAIDDESGDLVVYKGGSMFDFSSKVIGVIMPSRGLVDIF